MSNPCFLRSKLFFLPALVAGFVPAAEAVVIDIPITVDPDGPLSPYTLEVRNRAGVVLESGTILNAPPTGGCAEAEALVGAMSSNEGEIVITDASPSICEPTDGGTVRFVINLCQPVLIRICEGQGPCDSPISNLGPGSVTVDALTFGKSTTPSLSKLDIQHVVVLMMENRSFDHSLGWVPNATTKQSNTYNTKANGLGTNESTHPLAPDYQGCDFVDPNHGYDGGRCTWHNGDADGWLFAEPAPGCSTGNDLYAIGYYEEADLPFYSGLAGGWLVLDNYFAPMMAGTWPNKIYQYAADTDRLSTGDLTPADFPECKQNPDDQFSTLPTIFDLLSGAGRTATYYFGDVPLVALWGTKYRSISRPLSQFFVDAAAGKLADVVFIDPPFLVESLGTSRDDHPKADIRAGQSLMNDIYQALVSSEDWTDTVFVINHDEWGGFFDHVDPKAASGGQNPAAAPCQAKIDTDEPGLRGFRSPTFVMSPWAPRGHVNGDLFDHTSILRMIEWNWSLPNLTVRDQNANNLADVLCPSKNSVLPPVSAPSFPVSPPCVPTLPGLDQWRGLHALANSLGFEVPATPAVENPVTVDKGFGTTPRFLSFIVGDPGRQQAIRVQTQTTMPSPYGAWSMQDLWVGPPTRYCENSAAAVVPNNTPPAYGCNAAPGLPQRWYMASTLQCDPHFMDWHGVCDGSTCLGGLRLGACLV